MHPYLISGFQVIGNILNEKHEVRFQDQRSMSNVTKM